MTSTLKLLAKLKKDEAIARAEVATILCTLAVERDVALAQVRALSVTKPGEDQMTFDPVSNPAHYTEGRKHEPTSVIADWNLNFFLGNAIKYISRNGRKDGADALQDLEKARWYLDREISNRRAAALAAELPTQPPSTNG